ncbi:hypothetical protein CPB83DRAFT_847449 [Crepidotus variabilis]|uniref:MYND-type domain-containing protein n=1 Tax=Crepidotus variabilis TaxID=179855 RepID=A0A9P6JTW9_9AGAR|nr:hypothetical protein CPB83DRAFT_847449 [Crepidotus variabilis]
MENYDRLEELVAAIYSMPRSPTAEDFATMLGFVEPTESTRLFANLDEVSKLLAVCHLLRRLRMMLSERDQDIIYNKLAASHLPALVNNFLDAPLPPTTIYPDESKRSEFRLNNVYLEILGTISHTPYLSKFLRSHKAAAEGGKRLLKTIAERVVELAPSWDKKMLNPPLDREPGYYESAAGTAIQMISTLSAAFVKESVDSPILIAQETKQALIVWLRKWERRHASEFLGRVSERTRSQLERRDRLMQDANRIRRMLKNWDRCGYIGCNKDSDLKACARCHTVRYCCPEHQRAHWNDRDNPHKKFCFQADY